ncbi:hypothetical protein [Kribbella sp. VKM Ac-2568]|uniref:hypothetical protein n=1 Tax=Kribbella sp. VKM Ac-2568 TaxID=2512219 RepID=UPI00104966B6|nr:hypothetical protein [Kribbella sp. VKM Ac-2568]TCM35138.1 hypothetical protein EV648_12531 [Kribbella sp. VKM Ac-2568]
MTYDPLPIETVAVDDLALDLENYRIPVASTDENAALNYLYAEEEVFETARLIIRDGYFDNEVPIVVKDGDTYVVLEGNRRVSALKVLSDPTLIPAHEHAIRALLKRYETEADDLPDEIRVLVAPSRSVAARHIARLHTTQSKRPWSRDQQATYYYSLLDPTRTVDDIRQAYPGVNIPRFLRMAVMRRLLSGAKFKDRSLHAYVTGTELKMSSFEYAYKNGDIASAIGASFDKDGLLLPIGKSPEKIGAALSGGQLKALEYLMTQFRLGNLNTRSDEFRKGTVPHDALIAKLTGVEPQPVADSDPAPEPDTGGHGPEDEPWEDPVDEPGEGPQSGLGGQPPTRPPRGPNHPDTRDHLVLTGLDYQTQSSVNLQHRYHELRQLSLSKTPVAAAMLLRAVLESTIKAHFESTSTPATGELKACMTVVKNVYAQERPIRNAIDKIYSGNARTPGTVSWFNDVTHSADAVVTADTVRQALKLLHPLLRHLLRPAAGPAASSGAGGAT